MTESDQGQQSFSRLFDSVSDRQFHLLVGLFTGLAVYGLSENDDWLSENAHLGLPLWLLALCWPTLFLLCYGRGHRVRALVWVSGFCVLLGLLGLYVGWQASPLRWPGGLAPSFLRDPIGLQMLVACFIGLFQLQPAVWGLDRTYKTFFSLSWRNFLTVVSSLLLALGVWLVTVLWGRLFELIGVRFFTELFEENWFRWPLHGMSFALGISYFGTASSIIDRISTLLARFCWLLLPMVALAITCFLIALAFTGLQPLRDRDGILITANLCGLFLLNAVYQTGERLPYRRSLHRVLSFAVVLFPVLSGLAAYEILLRAAEHGWTPGRCSALLTTGLMALFSLGYATVIGWRRDDWPARLSWINRHTSWVVLGSLLLAASPVLDFKTISARSQLARVESGELPIEDLDVYLIKRELGRPGRVELAALLATLDATDPDAAHAVRVRFAEGDELYGWTPRQVAGIIMRPERFEVSARLVEVIEWNLLGRLPDVLYRVDLGGDETLEVVAVWVVASGYVESRCATWRDGGWVYCGYARVTDLSEKELLEVLGTAEFEVVIPDRPYKGLRIGEHLLLEH